MSGILGHLIGGLAADVCIRVSFRAGGKFSATLSGEATAGAAADRGPHETARFASGLPYSGPRLTVATLRKVQTIVEIERAKSAYNDFQTWCQEVVWWGNKKGAYLYSNKSSEKQLAGHF